MLHSLAARAYLMVMEGTSVAEAVAWVTRRIDDNLRGYYVRGLDRLLQAEGLFMLRSHRLRLTGGC